jgi:hypothetical protein
MSRQQKTRGDLLCINHQPPNNELLLGTALLQKIYV